MCNIPLSREASRAVTFNYLGGSHRIHVGGVRLTFVVANEIGIQWCIERKWKRVARRSFEC